MEIVLVFYVYLEKEGLFLMVFYLYFYGGDFLVGKSELIYGVFYLVFLFFVEVLMGMGYVVWLIDVWGFEECGGIFESELFK